MLVCMPLCLRLPFCRAMCPLWSFCSFSSQLGRELSDAVVLSAISLRIKAKYRNLPNIGHPHCHSEQTGTQANWGTLCFLQRCSPVYTLLCLPIAPSSNLLQARASVRVRLRLILDLKGTISELSNLACMAWIWEQDRWYCASVPLVQYFQCRKFQQCFSYFYFLLLPQTMTC